jgi:hypothetical protein
VIPYAYLRSLAATLDNFKEGMKKEELEYKRNPLFLLWDLGITNQSDHLVDHPGSLAFCACRVSVAIKRNNVRVTTCA